jgi:hypothetical protein
MSDLPSACPPHCTFTKIYPVNGIGKNWDFGDASSSATTKPITLLQLPPGTYIYNSNHNWAGRMQQQPSKNQFYKRPRGIYP